MQHWFSDARAFRRDPLQFLIDRIRSADEPLTRLRLGPRPMYLLTEPALIKPLLKQPEARVAKGFLVRKLAPIIGDGSLTMNGPGQAMRRRVALQHLARSTLDPLIPQFCGEIRRVLARLCRTDTCDPHAATAPLALRIAAMTAFGPRALSSADEAALVTAVHRTEDDIAAEMFSFIPFAPWRIARRRRRDVAKMAMSVVVDHVHERAGASSLLRSLQELGLSKDEVRDELLTLLLAGHHTSGSSAVWVLYHLAVEPGLAERIAAEAEAATDDAGELIPSRLKDCAISRNLVQEVLRLYPSSWWTSREVVAPIEFGKRRLRQGETVMISPWAFHRDPRHWQEPDAFDIDRDFTNPAFVPFGVGPRACSGIGLAMLELQLLALEAAAACTLTHVGAEPARPLPRVTLVPPEIRLRVRPRGHVDVLAYAQAAE